MRAHRHRVGLEPVEVVGVRPGERVVGGLGVPVVVAADEHREVDDPHVAVRALVHRRAAEVVAQRAEHLAGRVPLVGHEQQQVAGSAPDGGDERGLLVVATGTWRPGLSSAPPSPTRIHTRPLAPSALARSVRASSLLRPKSADAARHPQALDGLGRCERLELGGREHRR